MDKFFRAALVLLIAALFLSILPVLGNENLFVIPFNIYKREFGESKWEPNQKVFNQVDSNLYADLIEMDTSDSARYKYMELDSVEAKYFRNEFRNNLKFIRENYFKYKRQYFGKNKFRLDSSAIKIIEVNAFYTIPEVQTEIYRKIKKQGRPLKKECDFKKELCTAWGGGARYWQISYNANENKFYDFKINEAE
jgi:hypothetical protein